MYIIRPYSMRNVKLSDIEIIVEQTNENLENCQKIYDYFNGDLVETIMYLTGENIYIPSKEEIIVICQKIHVKISLIFFSVLELLRLSFSL